MYVFTFWNGCGCLWLQTSPRVCQAPFLIAYLCIVWLKDFVWIAETYALLRNFKSCPSFRGARLTTHEALMSGSRETLCNFEYIFTNVKWNSTNEYWFKYPSNSFLLFVVVAWASHFQSQLLPALNTLSSGVCISTPLRDTWVKLVATDLF